MTATSRLVTIHNCGACQSWGDDTLCSPGYRNCNAIPSSLAMLGPSEADSLQTKAEFSCLLWQPKGEPDGQA